MDVRSPPQRCFMHAGSFCHNWVTFFSFLVQSPWFSPWKPGDCCDTASWVRIFWETEQRKFGVCLLVFCSPAGPGRAGSLRRCPYSTTANLASQLPEKPRPGGTSGLPGTIPHVTALATLSASRRAPSPAFCPIFEAPGGQPGVLHWNSVLSFFFCYPGFKAC